jgi:hypothetical protein
LGVLFLGDNQMDGYYDCEGHERNEFCNYYPNNPLPKPIVWEPNVTYYNSGKFGNNYILLRIRHEVRQNIGFDQWQGDYIYPGISEDSIRLEGKASGNIVELSEMYDINRQSVASKNKISIDLVGKKAIWSDEISQYVTILQPDTEENVEIGLLQKYKKFETRFFDLDCKLEGKLQVGACLIYDKLGNAKSKIPAFGFPSIQTLENSVEIIFDRKSYGVCILEKYSVDTKSLDFKLVSKETNC